MGMPSIMELLILLVIPLSIFFLSIIYSYVTTFVLQKFSKKALPIKELWKKYFYIIILSRIISWLFDILLRALNLVSQKNQPINLIDTVTVLFSLLVNILLIYTMIKDDQQKSIGYKASTTIAVLNYLFYFVAIILLMLVMKLLR